MGQISLVAIAIILISMGVQADEKSEKYSSVAQSKGGANVYQERHEVVFLDRRVQKAKTQYFDPSGRLIGVMSSDFSSRVTIPDYEYYDLRTGLSHGIKLTGDKMTLWRKGKDGKIENSDFFESKFPKEALLVGCQGLHYYLIDNLGLVKERGTIPIIYFIPGKLDYYKFTLRMDREDEEYIYLKLSIDNFFLRLFTSSLDLKYRKSDRRLVQFSGLSNITDDKDQMQNVLIDYKYD
jgi:hypothetical protein